MSPYPRNKDSGSQERFEDHSLFAGVETASLRLTYHSDGIPPLQWASIFKDAVLEKNCTCEDFSSGFLWNGASDCLYFILFGNLKCLLLVRREFDKTDPLFHTCQINNSPSLLDSARPFVARWFVAWPRGHFCSLFYCHDICSTVPHYITCIQSYISFRTNGQDNLPHCRCLENWDSFCLVKNDVYVFLKLKSGS